MSKKSVWVRMLSITLLGLVFATPTYAKSEAQLLEEISKTLTNLGGLVNNTIFSTANLMVALAYNATPNVQNTAAANQKLIQARSTANKNLNAASNAIVSEYLKPGGAPTQNLFSLVPTNTNQLKQRVANFNIGTLLSNDAIQRGSDTDKQVVSYLQLAANAENSRGNLSLEALKKVSPENKNKLSSLANYVAMQSVGLNNLVHIYTRRMEVPSLGAQAGILNFAAGKTGQPLQNASPLQVQKYLAERRVLNPGWYRDMETASSNTIARETLYVLAEMRADMFKNRQQNERTLATLSAMQIQTNQILNKLNDALGLVSPGATTVGES